MTYTRLWPRNGKTNSFCYYTSATKGLGELLRAMYKEFGDCCPPIHRMSLHEKSLEPDDIMEQFVLTWNRVQLVRSYDLEECFMAMIARGRKRHTH